MNNLLQKLAYFGINPECVQIKETDTTKYIEFIPESEFGLRIREESMNKDITDDELYQKLYETIVDLGMRYIQDVRSLNFHKEEEK